MGAPPPQCCRAPVQAKARGFLRGNSSAWPVGPTARWAMSTQGPTGSPHRGPSVDRTLVARLAPRLSPTSMFASRDSSCGSHLWRCQEVAHLRAGARAKDPVTCNILRKCFWSQEGGSQQGAASVEPQTRPDPEAAPEQALLLGVRLASRRRSQQASVVRNLLLLDIGCEGGRRVKPWPPPAVCLGWWVRPQDPCAASEGLGSLLLTAGERHRGAGRRRCAGVSLAHVPVAETSRVYPDFRQR